MAPNRYEVLDYTSLAGSVFGNLERFGFDHRFSKQVLPVQGTLLYAGILQPQELAPQSLDAVTQGAFQSCCSYFFEQTRLQIQALRLDPRDFLIPIGWMGHSLWCYVGGPVEANQFYDYVRAPTEEKKDALCALTEVYFTVLSAQRMRPIDYSTVLSNCHAADATYRLSRRVG